ncbi:hypothetical protein GCM10023188_25990 [Pontibacter saemangeumensis]|uniref:50S ribosomal protein L29 n=1 Tax=Pontibacter saemangeumensis TaxID=1084525 RepID=A0ABP8LR73_9BACT
MNISVKIHELQRQVTQLSRKARTARHPHTKARHLAVAAAKRQHLRDLSKLVQLLHSQPTEKTSHAEAA